MIIKEFYEHNKLIDFYISRGIEFNDDKIFPHKPIFSYVAEIDNQFVGAITICKENSDFILDEVAVIKEREKQGICTELINTVIDRIEKEYGNSKLYLVAKNSNIFKNMGFDIIQREEAPDFSECFSCPDYQKKCFPKIMVKLLERKIKN